MEIKGRITEVEFRPRDYFKCKGMVNSTFNESRMWGDDANDGFSIGWFWYDSMPPKVLEAFTNIIQVVDEELQYKGIMPKKWPGVLDDASEGGEIFKFEIKKYKIMNPAWLSTKDQEHVISVTASSEWFTDDKELVKDIRLRLTEDNLHPLFKALEENL